MQCPYCKEEIKDGAIKCRYCNEFIFVEKSEEEKKIEREEGKAEATNLMKRLIKTRRIWAIIIFYAIILSIKMLQTNV